MRFYVGWMFDWLGWGGFMYIFRLLISLVVNPPVQVLRFNYPLVWCWVLGWGGDFSLGWGGFMYIFRLLISLVVNPPVQVLRFNYPLVLGFALQFSKNCRLHSLHMYRCLL